jgi:hypothetical protein
MSKSLNNNFYKKYILPFKTFLEKESLNVLKARRQHTNLTLTQDEVNFLKDKYKRPNDNFFKVRLESADSLFEKNKHSALCEKLVDASLGKSILRIGTEKFFKNIKEKELKNIISDPIWLSKREVKRLVNHITIDPGNKRMRIVDQDKKSLFSMYAKSLCTYFLEDLESSIYYDKDFISNSNEHDKITNIFQKNSEGLIALLFLKEQLFAEPKRFLYSTDLRVSKKAAEFLSIPQAIKIIKESPELYSVIAGKIDLFGFKPGPVSKEEIKLIKNIELPSIMGRKVYPLIKNKIKFLLELSYKYIEVRKEYEKAKLWTYRRDCIEAAESIITYFICKIHRKHMYKFMFLATVPEFKRVIEDKLNVEE